MQLFRKFQKQKYMRVDSFNDDGSCDITYYKKKKGNFGLPQAIILHPDKDHIYNCNGYRTIVVRNHRGETIDLKNFKSKYPAEQFEIAMNTKLMEETFAAAKTSKLDLSMILSIVTIGLMLIMLYFQLKGQGVIK
jgi:hypothetical protein